MRVLAMVLVASLPKPAFLAAVCGAAVEPHAGALMAVKHNMHHHLQHASCHACLLIINISEASKVQNHVQAYAATLLFIPAVTHFPPKCIVHHTLHTLIAICVHSALSKHNAVSTRQEQSTVLRCWMLLHATMYSLHTTPLSTCA
jgi:hypothetical protein